MRLHDLVHEKARGELFSQCMQEAHRLVLAYGGQPVLARCQHPVPEGRVLVQLGIYWTETGRLVFGTDTD